MRPLQTLTLLAQQPARGASTDAERRAAVALRDGLLAERWEASLETFWCRPNRALAHAWHAGLAIAGSLLAIASARAGAALVLAALGSVIADELSGHSLGRLLTPLRASQNVLAAGSAAGSGEAAGQEPRKAARRRILIVARLDTPRRGFTHRFGDLPHPLGWFVLILVWLLASTLIRAHSHTLLVRIAQLVPTAVLVAALAALLEQAGAPYAARAGADDAAVAIAVALAGALRAGRDPSMEVELVLEGAGSAQDLGLRRRLRRSLRRRTPAVAREPGAIVLAVAAGDGSSPRFLATQGSLGPIPAHHVLRTLARRVAESDAGLGAGPENGHTTAPSQAAQLAGVPALTIRAAGEPAGPEELDRTIEFGLLLADAILTLG